MEELPIDELMNFILSIINSAKTPALPIPAPLVLNGFTKPGMSPRDLTAKILGKQPLAGVPIGNLPSGAENISEKMELIRTEAIIEHLLENAKFTVVIPAGIPVTAVGASPTGPVVVQGVTTGLAIGTAVIS